jgi:hypothetical protein
MVWYGMGVLVLVSLVVVAESERQLSEYKRMYMKELVEEGSV